MDDERGLYVRKHRLPGDMNPTLTIITPTIDAAHYIDHAIDSVPRDEHDRIEHIVVHDGAAAFTERLSRKYPWLLVMPGPGRGATAAVAAAIERASGDFIFHLNSDDRMLEGSIAALLRAASGRPDVEVWTGGTRIFESDPKGGERTLRVLDHPDVTALTLSNVLDDLPLITARFVRKSVYGHVGALNEQFSACSDREFSIRMVLSGVCEAPLGVRVSELRRHDASSTIRASGRWVPPYLREHIELAQRQLSQRDLAPDLRSIFRDWHARETLRKVYYELRAGQFAAAARTMGSGLSRDPQWPWRSGSLISRLWLRRRSGSWKMDVVGARSG